MNRYFYLSEVVYLRRKRWLRKAELETAKVIGLPTENGGCYIVQRSRTGEHLKISHENLLEEKAFFPWRMYKATERGG